jgi:hypothetical protein
LLEMCHQFIKVKNIHFMTTPAYWSCLQILTMQVINIVDLPGVWLSCSTGGHQLGPPYWGRQLHRPVVKRK